VFQADDLLQQHYQLQKPLGRTAAGHQTWLAVDLQSNESVTLKLLAFSPQMSWEELKLFEREAQILQALNHPRIPRYRDYFDIDKNLGGGIPWFALVQEYIPGSSLQELLEKGKRFNEQEVRAIATEVLEILIYLHELSPPVLHRDIKPSNLILGEDNRIYLVDFGAVQAQAAVTGVTFTIVGTSGYAPLEQFWGRAVPASDLYALGATLIHLLTGITPADLPIKDSRLQFREKINLQSNLLAWIEKATEITVEKRFASAAEALHALRFQVVRDRQVLSLENREKMENNLTKIQRSDESTEIYIPAPDINRLITCFYNVVKLIIFLALLIFIGFTDFYEFTFKFYLLILNCSLLINWVLSPKSTLISFKGEQISFIRRYFNNEKLEYDLLKDYRQNIVDVIMCNQGKLYQVSIKTKKRNYSLGKAFNRTEAAWLTQEIQNWMKETKNLKSKRLFNK
jgi:serine/threonine protein kinase